LAKGIEKEVSEHGILGVFTGGLTATSAGIGAAVFFGFLAALFSKPADKS
jgi:stage V sporulation protein AE